MVKKTLLTIIKIFFIFLPIAAIAYLIVPFANWYLNKIPALGIDLYYNVTSVEILKRNFSFWFNGYKDIWFSGYPLLGDFPRFHFYAMLPFANIYGTVKGVQIYVVFTYFLLLCTSYLLFYKISKNIGLAFLLTVLVALSRNIYGAATWGGSIPYFATQAFLPLVLFFLINFFQTGGATKWLFAGSLFAGFAFLGHPLPVLGFIFPLATILLISYPGKGIFWKPIQRLKILIKFYIGVVAVAFILLYAAVFDLIFNFFGRVRSIFSIAKNIGATSDTASGGTSDTAKQIAKFYLDQINTVLSGTNEYMFTLLLIGVSIFILVFALSFFIKKPKTIFFQVVPFLLMVLYVLWHVWYNLSGKSFFPQGLYRAFWPFPVVLGAFVASLWYPLFAIVDFQDIKIKVSSILKLTFKGSVIVIVTLILFVSGYLIYKEDFNDLIDQIHATSDTSSAFPEVLNLKLKSDQHEKLKKRLVPSFINPNDKNKRLYESDATVNIWWNYLFDMPLARGYIDPPIGTDRRSGIFLLDVAIGYDSLVKDFKFNENMAKNYALYFIDWNGIYYFEGGHISTTSNAPPSSYLTKSNIFEKKEDVTNYGAILRNETKSGRPQARYDLPQTLVYYKIKDELTSPVVYGSSAPAILIFADDIGFEDIWRVMAAENLNSKFLIPVNGGKFIDDISASELSNFDAIVLHNYDYHDKNKAFEMLARYVEKGGKIFIDSGAEVKDSNSLYLPELFPFKAASRKELKTIWDLEVTEDEITKGVNFSKFGPPIFNNNPWKFSFPKSNSDLRDGAKVIVKNHGKPIIMKLNVGKGIVYWSGMNFPYHFNQYRSNEESKMFKNILEQLIEVRKNRVVPVRVTWERPEKIAISSSSGIKAVLVKEEAYNGWGITLVRGFGTDPKIYKAGPTFPGFMYIPIAKEKSSEPFSFTLSFNGIAEGWFSAFVSAVATFLILELIIFDGRIIGKRLSTMFNRYKKTAGSWWEKEEELE